MLFRLQRRVMELTSPVLLVLSVICLSLASSANAQFICPRGCLCTGKTIRCMHLHLSRVPNRLNPEIETLDLRFNLIEHIPPGTFDNLPKLTTLLLNNNKIKRLQNGAFRGLPALEYLYLFRNQITNIESRAFEGLDSLEQLYLYNNNLTSVVPNAFSNLPSLERLFLNNNNISGLASGTFHGLQSLKRLRLDGNNLICNCKIMWLVQFLKEASQSQNTQAAATCAFPASLRGENLVNLNPIDLNCRSPHITVEPSDVDATAGNNVYFTCRAVGDPEPHITWLHNEVEISPISNNDNKFHVFDDGTLMIQNATGEDQGQYQCMAKNEIGEIIAPPASLRYYGAVRPPSFSYSPEETEVIIGQSAIIRCAARGFPSPSIAWSRNGHNAEDNSRFQVLDNGSLHITNVQQDDHGEYTCGATNTEGSISGSATLIVLIPPEFHQIPEPDTVLEGQTVELSCGATGYPDPDIHWIKDGEEIPEDPRYMIMGGMSLRIIRVNESDQGRYECVAINKAGQKSRSAQVEVRPRVPPSFTQTPTNLVAFVGADIRLPCSATGDPVPVVTWSKDGVGLSQSGKFDIHSDGHLRIRDVGKDDEGRYECVARNSIGYISIHMELDVSTSGPNTTAPTPPRNIGNITARLNEIINKTILKIFDPNKKRNPSDLLQLFKFPSGEALNIARAAEIMESVLFNIFTMIDGGAQTNVSDADFRLNSIVSPSLLQYIANVSGCQDHKRVVNCTDICFHKKFRTFDGTCNNLQHPEWGASLTAFSRFLKPAYENGFNLPVGWNTSKLYFGYPKPSAREVSTKILKTASITDNQNYSHMVMQWGQFLDHDMDLAAAGLSRARFVDGVECSETCDNAVPCFPIQIPEGDPRIQRHQCMEFTRSSAVCGSGSTSFFYDYLMPREQMNVLSSYIDASNVYGSTKEHADRLRDFAEINHGKLRVGQQTTNEGKFFLPFNDDFPIDCDRDEAESPIPCFLAGDVRANEQVGLTTMHTLFMREHNRIVDRLYSINPHWDSERIYQETRKIVGAMMQHITYKHWLPKILGPKGMEQVGDYEGYKPSVDASIVNSFATGAFRFGHTLIQPIIKRLNSSFQPIEEGDLPLHKAFFSPFRLIEEGGIDPILRGLFGSPLKQPKPSELINTELTERLFHMAHSVALDLAALNVQRGRDHALPSYNEFRVFCGLDPARTFEDLGEEIKNPEIRESLKEVYGHPGNIDMFVGGLTENPIEGGLLGPTFTCILAKQFKRLRDGDRFWYENPGVFSPDQVTQLKEVSLARIICDGGDDIQKINSDVFQFTSNINEYQKCKEITDMDLGMWAECFDDQFSNGVPVGGVIRSRRSARFALPSLRSNLYEQDWSSRDTNNKTSLLRPDVPRPPRRNHRRRPRPPVHIREDGVLDGRIDALEAAVQQLQDTVLTIQQSIEGLSNEILLLQQQKQQSKLQQRRYQ